jgi:hypothetical protein
MDTHQSEPPVDPGVLEVPDADRWEQEQPAYPEPDAATDEVEPPLAVPLGDRLDEAAEADVLEQLIDVPAGEDEPQ